MEAEETESATQIDIIQYAYLGWTPGRNRMLASTKMEAEETEVVLHIDIVSYASSFFQKKNETFIQKSWRIQAILVAWLVDYLNFHLVDEVWFHIL